MRGRQVVVLTAATAVPPGPSDSGFQAEVESEQAIARGEVYMEMIEATSTPTSPDLQPKRRPAD
ncbi:hypothetical protein ACFVAQ_45150 [Streptomyces sp. NPDC057651]|uniref:hypothetical protein n=1 Tax=Streptomyces sp. NPDC057651 TaxID=3346194 RepID=UPI0036A8113E